MNLILFIGSGVSIPSGFPTVVTLSENILNSTSYTEETNFLKALKQYDEKASRVGGTRNITTNELVGEIYRNSTTYEDLYYLCEEIAVFDWGLHNNSLIPALMESLLDELSIFLKSDTKESRLNEIGRYAHASKRYINKAIVDELIPSKQLVIGLDLILQLATSVRVKSLDIITLNHDLLIEKFLTENGIEFVDGFGILDGDVRWFEPDTYLASNKVKLLKLHGSVDWYSFLVLSHS